MPNREPFEMHLNAIDDVTLRQLSDESEMNAFSHALAYNHERFENSGDLTMPTQKELENAVKNPDSIEVGGYMYLGIWQQKILLGGLMLRNYEGQIDLQFWLENNASKNAIASTAISAFTRLMVSRRRLSFDMIAKVANDNKEAMRVLGRSGYIETADNIKDRTVTFGVLSQLSEVQIMKSEEVRNSPELVVRALSVLDQHLDRDEEDEDDDTEYEEIDFETVSDNDEKITGNIYYDKKSHILSVDIYREVMDEFDGATRQDDNKYLLHTECILDAVDGEVINFGNSMVVRDYRDAPAELPDNRLTNSPIKKKTRKDSIINSVGLMHLEANTAVDQLSIMMRHNEDEILDILDLVMASSID